MSPFEAEILREDAARYMAVIAEAVPERTDPLRVTIRDVEPVVRMIEQHPAKFAEEYCRLKKQVERIADLLQPIVLLFPDVLQRLDGLPGDGSSIEQLRARLRAVEA